MKSCDVLVLGASAAGIAAGNAVKGYHPEKSVMLFRNVEKTVISCGIPYIYGEIKDINKDVVPDEYATQSGAELYTDEAVDGDLKEKVIKFASGE